MCAIVLEPKVKKKNLSLNLVLIHTQFPWCSGYHICLTRRRSPVRSRTETEVPCGLTARISGFHPEGPGSTPGMGILFGKVSNTEPEVCITTIILSWMRWPSG